MAEDHESAAQNREPPPVFARREAAAEDCRAVARVQRAKAGASTEGKLRLGEPFFMQVERGSAWSHKPTRRSVRLRHLHPFFSERSVAANALGLGPRDRRCNSCRSDQFQVRGPVSRAPARDAGEVGAIPTHLTNFARGDEVVESALCRREVSRCESDHERHFLGGSSNS